jgi:DNA-binding transcriptional MocR family regulator
MLSLCEAHNIPIVEDGFEEEIKYFGKDPPPIKSMDRKNIGIYLGTFSKVIFPGIRIGWITADKEFIRRLGSSLGVNILPPKIKYCNSNCLYCQYGWTDFLYLKNKKKAILP